MKYKLADLLTIYNGCDHKHLGTGDIPVYGSGGIMRYVDSALSHGPSILLPRKGTIDNIQYVEGPFWSVDTAYYTKINTEIANPYYLYCYLCSLDLSGLVSGTGLPSMTFDSYYHVVVDLPQIDCQNKVANCLMKLDRKIALNRKINTELEQMAKELYDYWFVQFDFPNAEGKPYKSSGGKMVYNPQLKRDIPEGWEVKDLPYIAKFENGIACQKYRPREGEVQFRVIKIDEMHNGFSDNTEFVGDSAPSYAKIVDGDLLFSWSASLEVMIWNKGEGVLNQHIFKVTPRNNYPLYYVYYQLLEYVNHFRKMAESRKTTMGHITQDHLKQSTICVPLEMNVCNRYEKVVIPIFNKIIGTAKESQRLTTLRDQLLPLLMNGQVTIE